MEWLWLCILSLALGGLVFVYLSKIVKTVDEPEEVPQADTEEDSGEEEKKPFPSVSMSALRYPIFPVCERICWLWV